MRSRPHVAPVWVPARPISWSCSTYATPGVLAIAAAAAADILAENPLRALL
jgi:hypothetical protein